MLIVTAWAFTKKSKQGIVINQDRPNVIIILTDDQGYADVGFNGCKDIPIPNIDRIANEGAKMMTYYAEQSCTAGRNAFFTGMTPLRTGMIPPQLPGSPSYLRPGTPAMAKFLLRGEVIE